MYDNGWLYLTMDTRNRGEKKKKLFAGRLYKSLGMKMFNFILTYFSWMLSCISMLFFSTCVFFQEHSWFTGQQRKGIAISFTPLYNFHLLHIHLDINRGITAESSPLHITRSQTQTENTLFFEHKSLTTKLYVVVSVFSRIVYCMIENTVKHWGKWEHWHEMWKQDLALRWIKFGWIC